MCEIFKNVITILRFSKNNKNVLKILTRCEVDIPSKVYDRKFKQMEILCFCFLQLIREQMEIKVISCQMRRFSVFGYKLFANKCKFDSKCLY